jgi:hypothetical protein
MLGLFVTIAVTNSMGMGPTAGLQLWWMDGNSSNVVLQCQTRNLAWDELHHEGIAGAEGYFGLWRGWGGVEVGHAPALGYGGDGEDAFHPGEAFAYALAAASAEGEVGELWPGGFVFWGEAVGVEA